MLDQYSVSENGYFFTDVSAPTVPEVSYGDLNPPVAIRFTVPEPGVTTFETSEIEIDGWYMPIFVNEENCIDDFFLCAVFVFVEAHDIEVDDWYPFRAENINNFDINGYKVKELKRDLEDLTNENKAISGLPHGP